MKFIANLSDACTTSSAVKNFILSQMGVVTAGVTG